MQRLFYRLAQIAAVVVALIVFGTAGFVIIEGYPVFDALYMTMITLTTVGYFEVHELSRAGRVFNIFLLVFGVAALFLAIGAVTQLVIQAELGAFFDKRRVKRMIDRLENHFIVCGFGRVGRGAADELRDAGVPFVVVDRHDDRVERAIKAGMLAAQADATQDETLREVGIERAQGLIAALATDADNLFLILSAKTLNPKLRLATRVSEEEAEAKMRRAGADVVFIPYSIAGHRLAQSLLRPHVHEFLDFTTKSIGLDVRIEQVLVPERSELAAKSLRETQFRRDLGVIVLAISRPGGQMQFNPPAEALLQAGDTLIVMGPPAKLKQLEKLLAEVRE